MESGLNNEKPELIFALDFSLICFLDLPEHLSFPDVIPLFVAVRTPRVDLGNCDGPCVFRSFVSHLFILVVSALGPSGIV